MTDSPDRDPHSGYPSARQQRTRWPGWVWLIPIAAVGFAAWLSAQEFVFGPNELTVRFADVEGVKPGAAVRYRGVQVGSVDEIALDDDLRGARLALKLTALKDRLGEGTKVWIVRPGLASGRITSLISGAHLAIEPGEAGDVEEIVGLEEPPIIPPDGPGRTFVLTADTAENLQSGAPVRFRGIDVGRVLGKRFGEDGAVEFPVFVQGEYAELVREATVFWRAGGLSVDTGAGGVDLDLPGLSALATGAVAFATPGVLEGPAAEPLARFALHEDSDAAETAPTGPRLAYRVVFREPAADIAAGAPVTLAGKRVGRVAEADLAVMPERGGLVTEVRIVLDAERLGIEDLASLDSREALRDRLNEVVERLVGAGMRAEVDEGGIVFGAKSVALRMQSDPAPASFSPDPELPEIPAAGGSTGPAARGQGAGSPGGGQGGGAANGPAAGAGVGAADAPAGTSPTDPPPQAPPPGGTGG